SAPDNSIEIIQGNLDGCPAASRLKIEHVANEPQRMPKTLARWHESLHGVGKCHQSHFVVIANSAESQDRSQFRGHVAFFMAAGAHLLTGAAVPQQHPRQPSLFEKSLDKRMTHAGCDIPANVANIAAMLIFADLFQSDAGAFEDTVIFPSQ